MYLLGIDNGGSDIKCAVYDLNGKELAISRTQIPMNIPEAGFTERDVENVWEANVKVIKAVLKKAEIPGEDVVAIGVTGYGNGMVLLDEEGKPVYQADRSQLHYRLEAKGMNTKQVVAFISIISLTFSIISIVMLLI